MCSCVARAQATGPSCMMLEVLVGLYENVQKEREELENNRACIITLVNPNASEVDRERGNHEVLRINIQKDRRAERLSNTQLRL